MAVERRMTDFAARWPILVKRPEEWRVGPNLVDRDRTRREFSWTEARAAMDGLPDGRGLNIAHEAVDRHAASAQRDRIALRCVSKDGTRRDFTYADLRDATNRFAHVLRTLGVGTSLDHPSLLFLESLSVVVATHGLLRRERPTWRGIAREIGVGPSDFRTKS